MKTLDLNTLVPDLSSNASGFKLFILLDQSFSNSETVILHVNNDSSISSSFLNSSIGSFIEKHGLNALKSSIKFKGTRTQYDRFVSYINSYSKIYHA